MIDHKNRMRTYDSLQKSDSPKVDYAIGKITKVHISSLTPKTFFEQYQKASIPVIITGLLDTISPWNLDYLCEHLGNQEFPIRYYGRSRYQQDKRQWRSFGSGVETQMMPFSQYAEMLRNRKVYEEDNYLGHCSLKNTGLEKELVSLEKTEQQLGLKMAATYFNLWIGLGGHTTCLHYDPFDVTLTQLHGAKKLILFPPSQLYNLYPVPILKQLTHGLKLRGSYSQVYPDRPNFDEFPKLRKAVQYRHDCIVNPGEVLFIPAGWWHEVISLGTDLVCSVNRFWHPRPWKRTIFSWSKWRIHLGSAMASSQIVQELLDTPAVKLTL